MSDTTTHNEQQPNTATVPTAAPAEQQANEVELGEGGKKAIQSERDARKQAEDKVKQMEAQLQSLQPMKEQMDKLRAAFGEPEQAGEDIVSTLQAQVAEMRLDNLVNNVARQHGITDDGDMQFLRTAGTPEQMQALAQRLKVSANPAPNTPGTPAPDAGQGARQSSPQAEEDAEYSKYYPNPSK